MVFLLWGPFKQLADFVILVYFVALVPVVVLDILLPDSFELGRRISLEFVLFVVLLVISFLVFSPVEQMLQYFV